MAERSPVALHGEKAAVRAAAEMPLAAGLAYEKELFVTCFAARTAEGVAAFLEKRDADFRGR
jgi:enoyl-CoA hydratase/carnithine racemase